MNFKFSLRPAVSGMKVFNPKLCFFGDARLGHNRLESASRILNTLRLTLSVAIRDPSYFQAAKCLLVSMGQTIQDLAIESIESLVRIRYPIVLTISYLNDGSTSVAGIDAGLMRLLLLRSSSQSRASG